MSSDAAALVSEMSKEVTRSEEWKDDLIVACTWLILSIYGFITNSLIIIGITSSALLRTSSSYWFIISICLCEIGMAIVSFAHIIPATAFHDKFVEFDSLRNLLMIFFYDIFWYTDVIHLGMMAMNRYISIIFPTHYKSWFSTKRTACLLVFSYFLGLCVSIPTLFPCCHTLLDSYYYITIYVPADTWYKYVDLGINAISLAVMVFSYTIIFSKVRGINRQSRRVLTRNSSKQCAKKELALFTQFFATSLVYLLTWTTWQWLPNISASKWVYFIMTSLFFVNNSALFKVNPSIYLLFNTNLRRRLGEILCRKPDVMVSSTQNISMKPFVNLKAYR